MHIPGLHPALDNHPLIPVNTNKQPLVKWEVYQTRCPNDEEITKWIQTHKGPWALVCGRISGIIVLDFDTVDAYEAVRDSLPRTWVAQTPKGYHVYFRCPDPAPARKIRLVDGMDLCGEGGYVLVPHEDSDDRFWIVAPHECPLADLPEDILAECRTHKASSPSTLSFSPNDIPRLNEGEGRNDFIFRFISSRLGKGDTEESAWLWAQTANGRFAEALPEAELRKAFNSAVSTHRRNHSQDPTRSVAKPAEPLITRAGGDEAITPAMFAAMPQDKTPWMIEGVIKDGGHLVVCGFQKTGKSILMLNLAAIMSTGGKWLGMDVGQKRFLYMDGENPVASDLRERVNRVFPALCGDPEGGAFVSTIEKPLRVTQPDGRRRLTDLLNKYHPQILFLDPFLHYFDIEENDSVATRQALDEIQGVVSPYGTSLIIVDHTRFNLSKTQHLSGLGGGLLPRGSKAKGEWAHATLGLEREFSEEGVLVAIKLHFTSMRSAAPRRPLFLDFNEETYVFRSEGEERHVSMDWIIEQVREFPGITEKKLVLMAIDLLGAGKHSVERAITACEKYGLLRKEQSGNATKLFVKEAPAKGDDNGGEGPF